MSWIAFLLLTGTLAGLVFVLLVLVDLYALPRPRAFGAFDVDRGND